MSQQKYPKAYEAYQQAVYRDGRNPTFWCSIGVLYYQINQYRDALDAYSRAIRLNPYISEVWYDLGTLVSLVCFILTGTTRLTNCISTNLVTIRSTMPWTLTKGPRNWTLGTRISKPDFSYYEQDKPQGVFLSRCPLTCTLNRTGLRGPKHHRGLALHLCSKLGLAALIGLPRALLQPTVGARELVTSTHPNHPILMISERPFVDQYRHYHGSPVLDKR